MSGEQPFESMHRVVDQLRCRRQHEAQERELGQPHVVVRVRESSGLVCELLAGHDGAGKPIAEVLCLSQHWTLYEYIGKRSAIE
jgi:hypothetical protein